VELCENKEGGFAMNQNVNVSAQQTKFVTVTIGITDQQWDDYLRPLLEAGRQHVKFEDKQQTACAVSFASNLMSGTDRAVYDAREDD
jgi:hypothetical protein